MARRNTFKIATVLVAVAVMMAAAPAFAAQKTITNSIGMTFVQIPAGSFYMGSCIRTQETSAMAEENKKRAFLGQSPLRGSLTACPSGAALDKDAETEETPQHKVRISKAFYMGKTEVTVGQFKRYIADTGRTGLLSDYFIKANSHGDSCAVSYVSWDDAQSFVTWLNGKEGSRTYRLPTEAEWEYAARAGTKTRFSFGDSATSLGKYAWYETNAYNAGKKYAQPVGKKLPNAWGLHDMHGNVYEWCEDWCSNGYSGGDETDPEGASSGSFRVFRGGSWLGSPESCRSAYRGGNGPGGRYDNGGFRLVLLPGQ